MKKTLAWFSMTVVLLLGLGIVLLATASTVRAQIEYHGDPLGYFKRQLMWLVIAFVAGLAATKFDYHRWQKFPYMTIAFYTGVFLLLTAVICPGIRREINGSYRWLILGPLRLQPSELGKLATVIVMSVWMDRIGWRVEQFKKGALIPAIGLAGYLGLVLAETDFGATVVMAVVGGALMFVAGVRWRYLIGMGLCGILGLGAMVVRNANRMARIKGWFGHMFPDVEWFQAPAGASIDPAVVEHAAQKAKAAAYQLDQALIAFKNSGFWGVGLNQSVQKFEYLPESHTDFIFAIGGEEMGLIFSVGVVLLFLSLLICGMVISFKAPDRLGRLMAFGMTLLLIFQVVFNIGVVTGVFPTKGIALPFMSYGGSNMLTALIAVGILFNIGIQCETASGKMAKNVVSRL